MKLKAPEYLKPLLIYGHFCVNHNPWVYFYQREEFTVRWGRGVRGYDPPCTNQLFLKKL